MVMKSAKRKVSLGLATAALVAAGIAAGSTPASAINAVTFDCFPAGNGTGQSGNDDMCWGSGLDNYTSSDGGAVGHGSIKWHNDTSSIEILAKTADRATDGKGPHLQVRYSNNGGSTYSYSVIDGPSDRVGPGLYFSAGSALDGNDEVSVRMCNGTSNGSPINCDGWHGPFHNY
jgi:hypothetical protein